MPNGLVYIQWAPEVPKSYILTLFVINRAVKYFSFSSQAISLRQENTFKKLVQDSNYQRSIDETSDTFDQH